MHAVTFSEPGDAEVLHWTTADDPTPGPGDVVVDVHAAGINNADLLQRRGRYRVPAGASPILGLECAGTISWVGDEVEGWSIGDRASALLAGGGYAEQVVAPATHLLPIPSRLTTVDAAALPEAACTVYSNLAMKATVTGGSTVLVHGGGSGIGTFAIQWAKALGARVITTAGSAPKLERARELGADVAVDYHEDDFVEQTLAATDGIGADAILDLVGTDYLERNIRSLAPDGHLVIIGFTGAERKAEINLGRLMDKRASVSSTTLRSRPNAQKDVIVANVRRDVWPFVDAGAIEPVIDTVLPIERAAEAHRLLEGGTTIGKVLLVTPLGARG